jgi:hypothetical protein
MARSTPAEMTPACSWPAVEPDSVNRLKMTAPLYAGSTVLLDAALPITLNLQSRPRLTPFSVSDFFSQPSAPSPPCVTFMHTATILFPGIKSPPPLWLGAVEKSIAMSFSSLSSFASLVFSLRFGLVSVQSSLLVVTLGRSV